MEILALILAVLALLGAIYALVTPPPPPPERSPALAIALGMLAICVLFLLLHVVR